MPLTAFLVGLYGFAILCALIAIGHGAGARRHWRSRRRFRACHRVLWSLVFVLLACIGIIGGTALLGYRRLASESLVATLDTRQLAPQRFAVDIEFPDGTRKFAEVTGDEWQLDARVIKWTPRAIELGAEPLYRVDRLSGRFREATQAAATTPSVVDLSGESILDLWQLKRQFPQWLPWIDAEFGSAAYLPMIDGASYKVSLSANGGLVARPADQATADKLKKAGW